MKLDKHATALHKMSEEEDNFVDASPAERVSMIWDLTAEVWSLADPQGVERRLQKHVTKLIRPRKNPRPALNISIDIPGKRGLGFSSGSQTIDANKRGSIMNDLSPPKA